MTHVWVIKAQHGDVAVAGGVVKGEGEGLLPIGTPQQLLQPRWVGTSNTAAIQQELPLR